MENVLETTKSVLKQSKIASLPKNTDPYNTKLGINVRLNFMPGSLWSIIWANCPHKDNVLESNIQAKRTALTRIEKLGWNLENPITTKENKISAQIVATKKGDQVEGIHYLICEFLDHKVYPHHGKNVFYGFKDLDLNMFICLDCKDRFYRHKNIGAYGQEHAHKYSEVPVVVPEIEKQKSPAVKKEIPSKPKPEFVATNHWSIIEIYGFHWSHNEKVEVDHWETELDINWEEPTKRNNTIIPLAKNEANKDYVIMQLSNLGFYKTTQKTIFSYKKPKIECSIYTMKGNVGYVDGAKYTSFYQHVGSGGGQYGPWFDARHQYSTEEEAALSAFYCLQRWNNKELTNKNCPPVAKKEFEKLNIEITALIAGRPEPQYLEIIEKENKVDLPVTTSKNREDLVKFRCTKANKATIQKMAKLEEMSVADLIHKALSEYPKSHHKAFTGLTQEEINQLIK